MAELNISTFNLAFFQKARRPLPDEQFQYIYSTSLKYFPLVDQLTNPILIARRKVGGQISLSPIFLQFLNIATMDFNSDFEIIKEISKVYFDQYKNEKISQVAIRLVSVVKANTTDDRRELIVNEKFVLSPKTIESLNPGGDIKIGIRLVFQRNGKRYELKVEPFFSDLNSNYIDFNLVVSSLDKSLDQVYVLINEEVYNFTHNIASVIPNGNSTK